MPFNKYSPHGLHLFHASLPPAIVYNEEDEARARDKGYSEKYIPREYPKALAHADRENQQGVPESHVTAVAQNAKHERELTQSAPTKSN
jgi:hypothetical protein